MVLVDGSDLSAKRRDLIASSSQELMLLCPGPSKGVEQHHSAIMAAVKRGTRVRILISDPYSLTIAGSEIRHIFGGSRSRGLELTIADGSSFLGYEAGDNSNSIQGVFTANKPLVQTFIALFENLWNQAVAYDKFKEADRIKDSYIEKQLELYDKLREADRLKDDFINIAAHELRTPIMPILGGLELVQSKLQGLQVENRVGDELAIIGRNAERLLKLSEDILEASRIETGRLKLYAEEVNLNTLIQDVITDVEKKYTQMAGIASAIEKADLKSLVMHIVGDQLPDARRPITFTTPENAFTIECDRNKIAEVIFNLIDNAMKFIDAQEGSVQISTHLSGANVIVTVRDNGRGIDASIKDKMFEKFTTRSEKGSGLGLYISKNIIEAHSGQIWAGNNSDGKGASFVFSIPVHFMRSEAPQPDKNPQLTSTQRTIDQLREEAMTKIASMKANLMDAREKALNKRNEALERYQKKVEESRNLIKARQDFINQQISYKRTRREVDSRIEKGLEGLQRLIEGLRENVINDETIEKIGLHPKVSEAIKREARKVTDSEFFKSLKRQIGGAPKK